LEEKISAINKQVQVKKYAANDYSDSDDSLERYLKRYKSTGKQNKKDKLPIMKSFRHIDKENQPLNKGLSKNSLRILKKPNLMNENRRLKGVLQPKSIPQLPKI
jgi:hypothetical protein